MTAPTVPSHTGYGYVTTEAFFEMEELPDSGVELANGEVIVTPSPSLDHGFLGRALFLALVQHVQAHGLGDVFPDNLAYELPIPGRPDTVRVPDVSFIRAGRIPRPRPFRRAFPFAPDLAVEVRSPSDRPGILRDRLVDYQDAGTPLVWVVDGEARSAEVYALGEPVRVLRESDALDGGAVLPGLSLPLARLFAEADG